MAFYSNVKSIIKMKAYLNPVKINVFYLFLLIVWNKFRLIYVGYFFRKKAGLCEKIDIRIFLTDSEYNKL